MKIHEDLTTDKIHTIIYSIQSTILQPKGGAMEIRFMPNTNARKYAPNPDEWDRQIVERVCHVVAGSDPVYEKDSGYRWQLGITNNWWMGKDLETGEFIVAYRYGNNSETQEVLRALRIFLIWTFGFQEWNKK